MHGETVKYVITVFLCVLTINHKIHIVAYTNFYGQESASISVSHLTFNAWVYNRFLFPYFKNIFLPFPKLCLQSTRPFFCERRDISSVSGLWVYT